MDVDGPEVAWEAVADEDASEIEKQPEFLVGDFEGYECVGGGLDV